MTAAELVAFMASSTNPVPRELISARIEPSEDGMVYLNQPQVVLSGLQIDQLLDQVDVTAVAANLVDDADASDAQSGILLYGQRGVNDGVVVSLPDALLGTTLTGQGLQLQYRVNGGA